MNNSYQDLRLHEWIARGREAGRIQNAQTVILAYCMDEREAMAWVADIVNARVREDDALVFMERAVQNAEHALM